MAPRTADPCCDWAQTTVRKGSFVTRLANTALFVQRLQLTGAMVRNLRPASIVVGHNAMPAIVGVGLAAQIEGRADCKWALLLCVEGRAGLDNHCN